ncbi:MAG: hypothetical protein ABIO16_14395 [Nocardioides sp.]
MTSAPTPAFRRPTVTPVAASSVAGVLLGGLAFLAVLLDFGAGLGRTAVALRYASNFFEAQGNAFLDGRVDVPAFVMGIEGFRLGGHTYMYFGPFPALLRIPILLVTQDFDGQMTVASMLLAWVVFAVFATRLTWLVRRVVMGPDEPVTTSQAVLATLFLAGITGGTTLTFDAALPWAYHEVYLWQTALVIAAAYWLVRIGIEPAGRAVAWLGLVVLCTVLTRTTGGWGVCLGALALGLWMWRGRSFDGRRRLAPWVLAAGAVPLAVGIAYNMVKFGHPYLFPLQDQVWTGTNQHRRFALESNGGTITGPQFFTSSLSTYFDPRGIRFVDYFPWVTLPGSNATGTGEAVIDQSYRTGSVTAFMPLWLVMAIGSLPVLLRRTSPGSVDQGVRALRPAALATFMMTGGVMAYGYLAHRYTSEFVPALVLGSMITLWALVARWAALSRVVAIGLAVVVSAGGLFSIAAQASTGFAAAATTYRGQELIGYVGLQDRVSGGPGTAFAGLISHSDALPIGGSADDLHIRGDCDGLYLNTGDRYEPWVVVEERATVVSVELPDTMPRTHVDLFVTHGKSTRTIFLQTFRSGAVQIGIRNETGLYFGPLFAPYRGEVLHIGLRTDSSLGYMELSSTPGGYVGYVPIQEWYADWVSRIGTVDEVYDAPTQLASGLRVSPETGLTPPLCARLASHNGIDLG